MKVYIQTEFVKDETINQLLNDAEELLFGLLDALGFNEEDDKKVKCTCKKEEEIDFDSLPIPENVKV